MVIDFSLITQAIHRAVQTNPPEQLRAIYKAIEEFGVKKLLSKNAKITKSDLLSSNMKMEKSGSVGWYTSILHLLPAEVGRKMAPVKFQVGMRKTLCPGASEGCRQLCLAKAGRMGMTGTQQAALRRTILLQHHAEGFFTTLILGAAGKARNQAKKGFRYAIRLNGMSDVNFTTIPVHIRPWFKSYLEHKNIPIGKPEKVLADGTLVFENIMDVLPYVMFYDYTKVIPQKQLPKNYHLTFSMHEKNRVTCLYLLQHGYNVTIVFSKKPKILPERVVLVHKNKLYEFPVLDGDKHDLRFLDPPHHVVGLFYKTVRGIPKEDVEGHTGLMRFLIPGDGKRVVYIPVTASDLPQAEFLMVHA